MQIDSYQINIQSKKFKRVLSEKDEDCFTLEAPNDAIWQIQFDRDDEIEDIILDTIKQLREFDADNEFMELWSVEFAERNHFKPSQFIRMLQEDEASFKELAEKVEDMRY